MWWAFLSGAIGLMALGVLNVRRCPEWLDWRVALLAGEFGYMLVPVTAAVGGGVWMGPGSEAAKAGVAGVAFIAAGLLSWPVVRAWAQVPRVRRELDVVWSASGGEAVRFSWSRLWRRTPGAGLVRTFDYAEGLKLDFYGAEKGASGAACVLMIHGGGWDGGDRAQVPALNHWLAAHGVAVAAISYRLAPAHRWPAQREDVLAAVAWLKAHAGELGIDARRLVLCGRSAGGQIAATVAYTAGDPAIRGVVALYAPLDLRNGYAWGREDDPLRSRLLVRQFLGGSPDSASEVCASASSVEVAGPGAVPTLLVHGRLDTLVWYRHSRHLAAKLAELGVPHALVELSWATHALEFNVHGPGGQLATGALLHFVRAVTA